MRTSPKVAENAGVGGGPHVEPDTHESPTNSTEHGADGVSAIARRAFERFQMRGGEHGHDQEDWLEAEQELNDHQKK
jgi:hypothetical protein